MTSLVLHSFPNTAYSICSPQHVSVTWFSSIPVNPYTSVWHSPPPVSVAQADIKIHGSPCKHMQYFGNRNPGVVLWCSVKKWIF